MKPGKTSNLGDMIFHLPVWMPRDIDDHHPRQRREEMRLSFLFRVESRIGGLGSSGSANPSTMSDKDSVVRKCTVH